MGLEGIIGVVLLAAEVFGDSGRGDIDGGRLAKFLESLIVGDLALDFFPLDCDEKVAAAPSVPSTFTWECAW